MRILIMIVCLLLSSWPAVAGTGLITVQSAFDVKTTVERLEEALQAKGMTLFNRIDHAAGAASVGSELRPTVVVMFGNPKAGTPLMQCAQSIAIDLPQKALIWQDDHGAVWLSYNNPSYLAERHGLSGCDEAIARVSAALMKFATAATTP